MTSSPRFLFHPGGARSTDAEAQVRLYHPPLESRAQNEIGGVCEAQSKAQSEAQSEAVW